MQTTEYTQKEKTLATWNNGLGNVEEKERKMHKKDEPETGTILVVNKNTNAEDRKIILRGKKYEVKKKLQSELGAEKRENE